VRGGYEADFVRSTAYGAGASERAKAGAEAAKAQLRAGNFPIFRGPLKDNRGNEVIAAGRSYEQADPWLEQMSFLVEGVNGSLT
jgi:simple sugar transport system substrate-binding protein